MKTLLKILVAILLVAALAFGVYCVLPETSKMYIKGNIQYRTDDNAKSQVDKIRNTKIPNTDVTFGTGLEKLCKSTAWYYEEQDSTTWVVTFYGTKATLDLSDVGKDSVYALKPMKVVFTVRNDKEIDITIQIADDTITDDVKAAAFEKIAKAGK